jgi:hypothetical protein
MLFAQVDFIDQKSSKRCFSFIEFILVIATNLTISVLSGYYLWYSTESDASKVRENCWFCRTNYHYISSEDGKINALTLDEDCDLVNGYDDFNYILKLYFSLSILIICENLFFVVNIRRARKVQELIIKERMQEIVKDLWIIIISEIILYIIIVFYFVCFIMLHVYRYRASGKYSSKDWITNF